MDWKSIKSYSVKYQWLWNVSMHVPQSRYISFNLIICSLYFNQNYQSITNILIITSWLQIDWRTISRRAGKSVAMFLRLLHCRKIFYTTRRKLPQHYFSKDFQILDLEGQIIYYHYYWHYWINNSPYICVVIGPIHI